MRTIVPARCVSPQEFALSAGSRSIFLRVVPMTAVSPDRHGWRTLAGPRYRWTSIVIAAGVALYATNGFLTASLLPSAVADIGGEYFYAWVTSVNLVASVIGAASVNVVLQRLGPRSSYLLGLALVGVGSLICAGAPIMAILLVGRSLQGLAGG